MHNFQFVAVQWKYIENNYYDYLVHTVKKYNNNHHD